MVLPSLTNYLSSRSGAKICVKGFQLGRSVLAFSAAAFAVSLASMIGIGWISSIASAQAAQALTPEEVATNSLVRIGSRTWNAQSIRSVDIVELSLATSVLDADRPEISSRMLPAGMPLEQFDRMINREISRRGMWGYVYESRVRGATGVSNIEPEATRNVLDFVRPQFNFPAGVSADTRQVRLDPTIVAIYDSSVDTLVSNSSGFRYRADTARAEGLPRREDGVGYGIVPNTDVADKRVLYALGAQAAFNQNDPNAQLPVPISTGQTLEQIQVSYCGLIARMYEAGRSLEPRDAGLTGAIEGRVDARNDFEPRDPDFGITGPCHR